jgi:hypothetical protein
MLTLKGEAGRSPTTQEGKKQNGSKQLKVHVTKEPLLHLLCNNNNKKILCHMGYKACLVPLLYPFANGWALVSIGLLFIANGSCVYIGYAECPCSGPRVGKSI